MVKASVADVLPKVRVDEPFKHAPLPRHELRGRNPPKGRANALTLPGAVRTDDEGKFRLDGLVPGGEYYLMASKYLPQVGDFIGVGYLADAVTVRRTAACTASSLLITDGVSTKG